MPIDPNLIGNTMANWQRPPAYDPLAQFAKIQALKNGITQQQLQQQAIQEGALGLQEKQREISGREALANAIQQSVKPGQNGAPPTIDHNNVAQILGSGPNADLIPGYMAGVAKQDADKAAAEKVQLENRASSLEQATRGFNAATDQKTWDSALSILHGLGLDSSKLGIPDVFSPEAKTAVINLGLSIKDQLAAAAQAKTAQAAADRATAAGTQADTAKEKERFAKVTAAKQAIGAATDQASLQGAFNNVVAAGATPEEVAQLPHVFSPQVVDAYRRSLLTGEQQTQADQAAANAKAAADRAAIAEKQRGQEIAISGANLAIAQQRFKQEVGAQGNEALVNVPANQRNAALADALKVGNEAATAKHAADEMQGLIDLARSGNKVAYAYAPTTGVLTINSANGSKRVNLNEIRSYEGAGSFLDSIQGKLGKAATGASIDASVLNDMEGLHKSLGETAQDLYKRKLDVVNQTYKSNFTPVPFTSAVPAWKTAARTAAVGATIPLPDGRKALKTGDNQFQIVP